MAKTEEYPGTEVYIGSRDAGGVFDKYFPARRRVSPDIYSGHPGPNAIYFRPGGRRKRRRGPRIVLPRPLPLLLLPLHPLHRFPRVCILQITC